MVSHIFCGIKNVFLLFNTLMWCLNDFACHISWPITDFVSYQIGKIACQLLSSDIICQSPVKGNIHRKLTVAKTSVYDVACWTTYVFQNVCVFYRHGWIHAPMTVICFPLTSTQTDLSWVKHFFNLSHSSIGSDSVFYMVKKVVSIYGQKYSVISV